MSPFRSLVALSLGMSFFVPALVANRSTEPGAEVLAYSVTTAPAPTEATFAVAGLAPAPLGVGTSPAPPQAPPAHVTTGAQALRRLDYPWQQLLPGWTIEFKPAKAWLRGLTVADDRRIEIYVHTTNTAVLARIVAHELGHAADLTYNDTSARRQWKSARGISTATPWWPAAGYPDFSTGSGDFAECFAAWQVGSSSRSDAGACSNADINLVVELLSG